jgi:hypothetical protein
MRIAGKTPFFSRYGNLHRANRTISHRGYQEDLGDAQHALDNFRGVVSAVAGWINRVPRGWLVHPYLVGCGFGCIANPTDRRQANGSLNAASHVWIFRKLSVFQT